MEKVTQWIGQNPKIVMGVIAMLVIFVIALSAGVGVAAKSSYNDGLITRWGSAGANSAMTNGSNNASGNYSGGNSLLVLQADDDSVAVSSGSCSSRRHRSHSSNRSSMSDGQLANIAQGHA